ncbi:hypothetical protein TNIN_34581 [Trichonephila inaurata madagascariensis]|uniref:Uncharacterized protein n=1 Tax=Trichonephila inaurata madagascariensis TaxID=2747483 RepID=A0A8X6YEW7_9ARAC|nr:hypothetical protein TNIN_34581 [Trichonephila inaurata madagascariensis]
MIDRYTRYVGKVPLQDMTAKTVTRAYLVSRELDLHLTIRRWSDALPAILLGFRMAYKEDLQSLSAELVYGPIQLVENPKCHFDSIRPSPGSGYSKSVCPSSLRGLQPRHHQKRYRDETLPSSL